jgi:hypothetical protein
MHSKIAKSANINPNIPFKFFRQKNMALGTKDPAFFKADLKIPKIVEKMLLKKVKGKNPAKKM